MKTVHSSVAGPFRHENLEIFILRGPEIITHRRFIPLHEAMQAQTVTVHETGSVGQLEVENHGEEDLYIQAGDVVKGGRQDRTLGVDLVVRSGGGRIPIPSFCVEAQRWHRRRNESDKVFSASDTTLASKALRLSAKLSRDQGEVWDSVAHFQKTMSDNLATKMQAAESPSSYQLSMEQDALKDRKRDYASALEPVLSDFPDAVGFAFAIHGKLNSADAYGSHDLFRRLWTRALDAAITEAIMESRSASAQKALTSEDVHRWLMENADGNPSVTDTSPDVRMRTVRGAGRVTFDTVYRGEEQILHRNVISLG